MDLVECIEDTDRDGVFKITDKDNQKFVLIQNGGGKQHTQVFDLSELELSSTGV